MTPDIFRLATYDEFKATREVNANVKVLPGELFNARRTSALSGTKETRCNIGSSSFADERRGGQLYSFGSSQADEGSMGSEWSVCVSNTMASAMMALPPAVYDLCCITDGLWEVVSSEIDPPRPVANAPTKMQPAVMMDQGACGAPKLAQRTYDRAEMLRVRSVTGANQSARSFGFPRAVLMPPTTPAKAPGRAMHPLSSGSASAVPKGAQRNRLMHILSCGSPSPVISTGLSHEGYARDSNNSVQLQEALETLSDDETDVESVCSEASDEDEPSLVLVGPTKLAVAPYSMDDLWLPTAKGAPEGSSRNVKLRTGTRQLAFSDAMRLTEGRTLQAPLSFGSVLHICHGADAPCRPCMFERWAGRCSKKWLCDFCHMHAGQKQRRKEGKNQPRA
eukprot:CAMPEP_0170270766 /NCGR_PEP_ID=MMETSP0116_2-20130129/35330_1 /TAXON_ID=400756 /ORGANISM="Durinskia baltica, Strain CSIRO CS-38" /LENGTH=392 /DNA_ID=CAMNT_0010521963 /DNA_START=1 /DNA_END=1179 /DNA_ORIENTATION=-